jgi:phosphatidate cytidylyltransferase
LIEPGRRLSDPSPAEGSPDLRARVLTALVLAPAGLGAVWAGGWVLAAACALAAGVMAWEWLRLSARGAGPVVRRVGEAGAALFVLGLALRAEPGAAGAGFWVQFAGILAMAAVTMAGRGVVPSLGLAIIAAATAAFWTLRELGGLGLLVPMLAAIWAFDSAAYLAGRWIGGPKLWPRASPNKTWSGFAAGLVAAGASAALAGRLLDADVLVWGLAGMAIGAVAQAGDIAESLAKRAFGAKDASGLLPGHGGVLDRLDGHMSASLVMLAALFAAPGLIRVLT